MGFLTMKSPFLQNINKANHAVDIFLRHHLQALEAGDASKLSQGHWVSLALHIRAFQALIRTPYHLQDYLEATKPTDIIPQPKKKNATITLTHSKLQRSSPRNQQQKTRTPFPPPNIPKKNGQTSSWPREYGHAPLPGFKILFDSSSWLLRCKLLGCWLLVGEEVWVNERSSQIIVFHQPGYREIRGFPFLTYILGIFWGS